MTRHDPEGSPTRWGSSRRWSGFSIGLVAVVLGGALTLGLHPSAPGAPGSDGPATPSPDSTIHDEGGTSADTLLLTGGVPDTGSAGAPGASATCPPGIIRELRHVFRWHMNFPRDLRPGDAFRAALLASVGPAADGGTGPGVGELTVLGAEIETRGHPVRAVRYGSPDGGETGYFQPDGTRVGAGRIPTPDGFRLTSRFDWQRVHPVYRKPLPHMGVDYAVPHGGVVRAVAEGTVSRVGRIPGLGLVVQLRHDAHRSTRYAHLSSVEPGIRPGRPVGAGEPLGRAGATGIATAPHLHFELLLDGEPRNPLSQEVGRLLPSGLPADLAAFAAQRDRILELLETGLPADSSPATVLVDGSRQGRAPVPGPKFALAQSVGAGPFLGSGSRSVARWPPPSSGTRPADGGAGAGTRGAPAADGDGAAVGDRERGDRRGPGEEVSGAAALDLSCVIGRASGPGLRPPPYVITSEAGLDAVPSLPVWGGEGIGSGGR